MSEQQKNKLLQGAFWKTNHNPELVPKNKAGDFPSHGTEAWKLFAKRMQRNPYMKAFVAQRDPECRWCGKGFRKPGQLHHIDYEHVCSFGKTLEITKTTPEGRTRTRTVPDCESCHKEHPEWFAGCAERVALVHSLCNAAIDFFSPGSEALSEKNVDTAVADK